MVSSEIISLILQQYKSLCAKYPHSPSFIPNKNGDSFYLLRKRSGNLLPTQIRLSNHGTYLNTWVDRDELGESVERINPAFCLNISIVFVDEGEDLTKDCKGMPNCDGCEIEPCKPQTFEGQDELGRPFTVTQFVYKSKFIRRRYINGLTKALMEASVNGKFIDPLVNLYRAAKGKELHSQTKLQNNNNIKTENYMRNNKRTIKLSESDLHRVIKESVRRILNEDYYDHNKSDHENQLTIDDLMGFWERYGGLNERVEVFDGVNGFKTVHWAEGNLLFLSRKDYDTYLKRGEEYERERAEEHSGKYGGGEGNQYLSNPSSLPAGLH